MSAWFFSERTGMTSPRGRYCNSGSTPYRVTLGPRKLEQEVSILPGSAAPACYRRSAGYSCGSRLLANGRGQDEEERRSPPAVLLALKRDGGGDSDGIKERWSGLHFCSGDTSEPDFPPGRVLACNVVRMSWKGAEKRSAHASPPPLPPPSPRRVGK